MLQSVTSSQWKGQETLGNASPPGDPPDDEAPEAMQLLPRLYLSRIPANQAVAEAARYSGKSDEALAREINISTGYMSKFLRGVWAQWARRTVAYCRATKSLAPLQWMADQLGCDLVPRDPAQAEIRRLEAALAEAKKRQRD